MFASAGGNLMEERLLKLTVTYFGYCKPSYARVNIFNNITYTFVRFSTFTIVHSLRLA